MTRNRNDAYLEVDHSQQFPRDALVKRTRGPLAGVILLLTAVLGLSVWTVQRLVAEGSTRSSEAAPVPDPTPLKAAASAIASVSVGSIKPPGVR